MKRCRKVETFTREISFFLISSVLLSGGYSTAQTKKENAADPTKYALILSSVSGDEEFAKKFAGWTAKMYDVLCTRMQFSPDNVYVLSADAKPEKVKRFARATADEVMRAFTEINGKVTEQSLVFVFMVGHGSFDGQRATFNLVGRDLTAEDYAAVIRGLKTKRVVWVNTASASGAFLRPLSQTGAVVITATRSGHEQNATNFAEFFIQALSSDNADTDKNERTSLFEAFTFANRLTSDYYKGKGLLATEHPVFDDNSDGVGHNDATEGEGLLARTFYLDSPAAMRSDDPEIAALIKKKEETERALETLKAKKSQMNEDDYERELEKLLVELAKTDQRIKAKNK
jgi:hypothetical protein